MDVFKYLTPDSVLLTPNRRLSAALLKQYNSLQKKTSWLSPSFLPLSSWLEKLWRECIAKEMTPSPFLLSADQEQIVWEDILRRSPENEALLQVSRTSELAKSAWGILQQWQVDVNHSAFKNTDDYSAFQSWAKQFRKRCTQNNWLDQNNLANAIIEKIKTSVIVPPKHLLLVGFTEISPLHQHLLNVCEEYGCRVMHFNHVQSGQTLNRISLIDTDTELYTMARWAKATLEKKPTAKIGCIVPNLEDKRDQIIHVFSDVFSEKNIYTLNYTELPFNISAGKTLGAYPIIHTALQLLGMHSGKVSIAGFSSILRSPFVGDAEYERLRRAAWESRLSFSGDGRTVEADPRVREDDNDFCPALEKRLKLFFEKISTFKKKSLPSTWVKHFIELLKILGWPGERKLNSTEYQIVHHSWIPLLSQYAAFDTILEEQTFSSALHYLTRLAANTVFQPQSPEAPIQILGMLEAAELPFDFLWVSGLDDSVWPSPAKPNPFIPHRLQKSLNMPNASPERELMYCKKLTEQLKNSAKHVIFSHAAQNEHAELRPSALIKNIEEISELTLSTFCSTSETVFQTSQLETLIDNHAPPVSEQEKIRGGTSIFKLQAACPFKAFAEIRLHAAKLEAPSLGLRPQDRGNIVHKALEFIWHDLKDLTALKNLSEKNLNDLIHKHAQSAINLAKKDSSRYLILELERLKKILHNWLQLEKMRPNFKVIFREEERIAQVGKIEIKLRADRVDELDDGTQLIIDYKTGKNNQIKSWFDEKPDEPQLPLYCITDPLNTIGISFAEIHPDSMKIKGVSKMELNISGIAVLSEIKYSNAESWEAQIEKWKLSFEKLGDDFYRGDATVSPKNNEETCRYCHLQAFCRVYEVI